MNTASSHGRTTPVSILIAAHVIALPLALAGCTATSSESRAAQADDLLKYGRYEEAAKLVEPVVQDDPGDWRGQYAYGRAMLGMGKLEDARRSLDRAYRLRADNEDIVAALAECMARQKDVKDAYQLLRSFGKDFRSWRAYLSLSRIAESAGDPDTAALAAVDSIKVNEPLPGQRASIEPYMRDAELCFSFGKEADGVRRLRQAYGIAPEDPRITRMLNEHGVKRGKDTALPLGP
jgi:tetratricopeptide (TPR) repeat protein